MFTSRSCLQNAIGDSQSLAKKNPHPRDERIVFTEEGHRYSIDGISEGIVSTTKLIGNYFEPFKKQMIAVCCSRTKNPDSLYFGKSAQEIIQMWEDNARLGTEMHAKIEAHLNGLEAADDSEEFQMFQQFLDDHPHYVPVRTEMLLFSSQHLITGSIDCLARNTKTGKYVILDWKRARKIDMENKRAKGKGILSHLQDCNFIHYSLQQCIYRHLLETWYRDEWPDLEIEACYLVILHPEQVEYELYKCADLRKEVEDIFQERYDTMLI